MRDVTFLHQHAMHPYEVGRVRFAARVALVIIPLTLLCAWETGAVVECVAIGSALVMLTTAMRWWHRQGPSMHEYASHARVAFERLFDSHWPTKRGSGA